MSANRPKKNRSELEDENHRLKQQLKFEWVDRIAGIITVAIPWTVIAYLGHGALTVVPLIAGTTTKFDFSISISLGLVASGLLNAFQFVERGRFKRQLSAQLNDCQKNIDPSKGTSGLKADGSTHPKDKP